MTGPVQGRPDDPILLAAMISHEVRGILAPARAYARAARSRPNQPDLAHAALEAIDRATERAEAVERVLKAELTHAATPEDTDVELALRGIADDLFWLAAEAGHQIRVSVDEATRVRCSPDRFDRIVANLAENGLRSMRTPGVLTLDACFTRNNRVLVRVLDEGSGVAEQIMRPGSRHGGLGLRIVRMLAEAVDGAMRFRDRQGGGIIAEVEFNPVCVSPEVRVPLAARRVA